MTTDFAAFLTQYFINFPGERDRLAPFVALLQCTTPQSIIDRKTSPGHITASAFVLNSSRTHLLLLHHRFLNRWLQPGGHVDTSDYSLPFAALREVHEETGLNIDISRLIHFLTPDPAVPLDIDIHPIPENKSKSEPAHFHHDFRYLFHYTGSADITLNTAESKNFRWQSLASLAADPTFAGVVAKIHRRPTL